MECKFAGICREQPCCLNPLFVLDYGCTIYKEKRKVGKLTNSKPVTGRELARQVEQAVRQEGKPKIRQKVTRKKGISRKKIVKEGLEDGLIRKQIVENLKKEYPEDHEDRLVQYVTWLLSYGLKGGGEKREKGVTQK